MTADGLACSFEHLSIGKDFVFEKDVSNSCTEKDVLVYMSLEGVFHSHETEMIQIRLKQ